MWTSGLWGMHLITLSVYSKNAFHTVHHRQKERTDRNCCTLTSTGRNPQSHLWAAGCRGLYAAAQCRHLKSALDFVFPAPPLRCIRCCSTEGKQPLVHHELWTGGHMGRSFQSDTQKARSDWFWTNLLQIIFPLGKHKRTHFPLEWATMQRAIFRSHILPVWGGAERLSYIHEHRVWCGTMTRGLLESDLFTPEFWSHLAVETHARHRSATVADVVMSIICKYIRLCRNLCDRGGCWVC